MWKNVRRSSLSWLGYIQRGQLSLQEGFQTRKPEAVYIGCVFSGVHEGVVSMTHAVAVAAARVDIRKAVRNALVARFLAQNEAARA